MSQVHVEIVILYRICVHIYVSFASFLQYIRPQNLWRLAILFYFWCPTLFILKQFDELDWNVRIFIRTVHGFQRIGTVSFPRKEVDEERDTDSSNDDKDGGCEDVVPVEVERDLVTSIQTVWLAVPVERAGDTSPVITSPLCLVPALPTAGWVGLVEPRRVEDRPGDTDSLVGFSRALEVSLTPDTQTAVRLVREHVAASVGLQTLVSPVIALLGSVAHKLLADTERVLAFESQGSVLQLTLPQWRLFAVVTLDGLGLTLKAVASPVTAEMSSPAHAVTAGAGEEVAALALLHTLVTVVSTLGVAIADQVLDERLLLV